ncbi:MAG: CsbD family protein [Actinobacteria bacterium]|jgi:uncharacterized protein YjbJ (UPF0337 family)|nr:CsbD family protein [Actinomycetota bacterium]
MDINSDQAKGRVKEAAGDLTGNDKLKNEGKADQTAGDAKKLVHDVADKADALVDKVKDAVHKDEYPHPLGRPGHVRGRPRVAGSRRAHRGDLMMATTHEPDPDDAADDELAAERAGQSTTVEEAMDAATDEEGFVDESAYTPSAGMLDDDPGS